MFKKQTGLILLQAFILINCALWILLSFSCTQDGAKSLQNSKVKKSVKVIGAEPILSDHFQVHGTIRKVKRL